MDIGVGDYVTPGPQEIEFPTILKELPPPILEAYSIETLISEKFNAMIDLGELNSRLKDFYDIYIFVDQCDEEVLKEAIQNTFNRRKTVISKEHPVFEEAFYENSQRLKQWTIFLDKNQLKAIDFKEVYNKLKDILYPIYSKLE